MDQMWIRGPVIGRGATATVSLASSVSNPHRLFAVKSSDISGSVSLQNEHNILSNIGVHPNIIASFGFDVSDGHFNLLTEYVSGGTLAELSRNQEKAPLNEPMIRFYTSKILMGLDFLHANGVVHCDIKSENVLVGENGIVKIADLGFSKTQGTQLQSPPATVSGTPAFMAPEVARGEAQGFAADIWALGCTIVEMATGKSPWPEETNPVSALYRIGFLGDVPTIPSTLSEKGREFVGKCLIKDPTERWTARELLNHPFCCEKNVNVEESPLVKNRSSPTCVLDLAFWDQLDSAADDEHQDCDNDDNRVGVCSNSAFERIERLYSSPPSTSSWAFDENWITVRTNWAHQECQENDESGSYDQNASLRSVSIDSCTSTSASRNVKVGSSNTLLDSADDDDDYCVLLLNPKQPILYSGIGVFDPQLDEPHLDIFFHHFPIF